MGRGRAPGKNTRIASLRPASGRPSNPAAAAAGFRKPLRAAQATTASGPSKSAMSADTSDTTSS